MNLPSSKTRVLITSHQVAWVVNIRAVLKASRQAPGISERHLGLSWHHIASYKLFGRGSRSIVDKPYREKSVSKDKAEGRACTSKSLQTFLSGASRSRGISPLSRVFKQKECSHTNTEDETLSHPCSWAMKGHFTASTVIQWPWHLPAKNKMSAQGT